MEKSDKEKETVNLQRFYVWKNQVPSMSKHAQTSGYSIKQNILGVFLLIRVTCANCRGGLPRPPVSVKIIRRIP